MSLTLVDSIGSAATRGGPSPSPQSPREVQAAVGQAPGGGRGAVVVLASLQALALELTSFPVTTRVRVRVGAAGVASPFGQLFQAGQLVQRWVLLCCCILYWLLQRMTCRQVLIVKVLCESVRVRCILCKCCEIGMQVLMILVEQLVEQVWLYDAVPSYMYCPWTRYNDNCCVLLL